MFVCNGFSFDVIAVLTPTVVDAEKCLSHSKHLCTVIPVGEALAVPLMPAETAQQFSLDNQVPKEESSEECPTTDSPSREEGAFVSLIYVNLEGTALKLLDNYVTKEGAGYIISLSGDILDSSPADKWTDGDGESHKPMPCEECHRCYRSIESSPCSLCFYVTNISTLQSSMESVLGVLNVGISSALIKWANDIYIEPATKGYQQKIELVEKLKEKGKKYKLIESETRRFVAMTKEYGEIVEEAYVEYGEEKDFNEFASAAENTSGLRKKFEEVTNKHEELIHEVEVLKNEADGRHREMSDRANNLRDLRDEIFQQLQKDPAGACTKTASNGLFLTTAFQNASYVGFAGSAALIGLLGYSGYKLLQKSNEKAKTNFAYLAKSFAEISRGIDNISRHLNLIQESLRNIESKWRKIIDEDGNLVGAGVRQSTSSTSDGPMVVNEDAPNESSMEIRKTRKERRLAEKIVKKVRELMEACENYERRSGSTLSLWK